MRHLLPLHPEEYLQERILDHSPSPRFKHRHAVYSVKYHRHFSNDILNHRDRLQVLRVDQINFSSAHFFHDAAAERRSIKVGESQGFGGEQRREAIPHGPPARKPDYFHVWTVLWQLSSEPTILFVRCQAQH